MTESQFRGLALLIGMMYATDIFSAYMSSPWLTEAFGATETRAASARRLVAISVVTSLAAGGTASYLTKSPWPVVGCGVAAAMMWYMYDHALQVGMANHYQGVDLSTNS